MIMNIPDYVKTVVGSLEVKGFSAYLVGGCVRDFMSGITPHDYDIATDALPEEMKDCFRELYCIDTGIKHGTVTVMPEGKPVEVTTFRIDGEYLDSRRPESVLFTQKLCEDLARRDFTVNAMAYSEKTGIVDLFGGEQDLRDGIIRAVGNPEKRFNEDALRIMRALRFSSCKGFEIEKETEKAMISCKDGLLNISSERILDELLKLLTGGNCLQVLLKYPEVLGVFIPEIIPMIGFSQHSGYHRYDVWEHTAHAVAESPCDIIVRLSMLLHDVGKPPKFFMDEKGAGHFYGHEELSSEMAEKILIRLKSDRKTKERVCFIIKNHHLRVGDSDKSVKKALSKVGKEAFFQIMEAQKADDSAKAEFCKKRLPEIESIIRRARTIIEKNECLSVKALEIDGNDLLARGFKGREIGEELERLLGLVLEGKLSNERNSLLKALKI